jgi:hypothetical protein
MLIGVTAMIYQAFRPPSAADLYHRAARLVATGAPEDRDKARTGPIADYLAHYSRQDDEQTRQIQAWADDYDVRLCQGTLATLFRLYERGRSPETEAASNACRALEREKKGDLVAARERWLKVQEKAPPDSEERAWGLLGKRRTQLIDTALENEELLQKKYDLVRNGQDVKMESQTEEEALKALRLERFGDLAMAHEHWQELRRKFDKDSDQMVWYLLAIKRATDLAEHAGLGRKEAEIKAERIKIVTGHLDEARSYLAKKTLLDSAKAGLICQEVIYLYRDDPETSIKGFAGDADALLKKIPKLEDDIRNGKP